MKILDCTLRDGGYYTNWDFSKEITDCYFQTFNTLPVDYLEIGYRSNPMKEYLGQFFYCPVHVMQNIRELSNKKLAIILNEKDVRKESATDLLNPCLALIDLIRIAIDPQNMVRALGLAEEVKKMGFKVGFNVMYMSTWKDREGFMNQIKEVGGLADYFYMVDSFGGVYPEDVIETIDSVKEQTDVPLGFHGHNNLELALINTLTAIEHGVSIIDATVTGMGRGAGNLKTELLLTVLNAQDKLDLDFNALSKAVAPFLQLQNSHKWGTSLPYMVSGAHSLPQKQVMEWVSKRYFSFNSIIRALANQSKGVEDNEKLQILEPKQKDNCQNVLIVGGGPSVVLHAGALRELLSKYPEMVIIHASAKNAKIFFETINTQYFCLVGNEGHRLEDVFGDLTKVKGKTVLPPFPRKMGTYIPKLLKERAFELMEISFTDKFKESHTALALQIALVLNANRLFVTGYDGYSYSGVGDKEQELFRENEFLFQRIKSYIPDCTSITPTKYTELKEDSIYAKI